MPPPRIVVVGSLMQDIVVRAPRLPAADETLFGHSVDLFTGGKGGNQAIAAARLGAFHVHMVGKVGVDAFGDNIVAALDAAGVDTTWVARDSATGTGIAIPIVLDDGSNSIISVPRANLALTAADIERSRDAISSAEALLIQQEVALEASLAAVRIAREAAVRVVFNAAPVDPGASDLLAFATVLVVNEPELDALVPSPGDARTRLHELHAAGPEIVVLTLGEAGSIVSTRDGQWLVDPFPVEQVDSVGAGDAFCGALAVRLAAGDDVLLAARFASAAGALAVTRPGAAASIPTLDEVQGLLASEGTISSS